MPDPKLTRLILKNLLRTIHSSVSTDVFRSIYVRDQKGYEFDALDDGRDACAYHVSGILAINGLIDQPHATVKTTLEKMKLAGWRQTKKPSPGDVICWPATKTIHQHLGFYVDEQTAISNSSVKRQPSLHEMRLRDGRLPSRYYTNPLLKS